MDMHLSSGTHFSMRCSRGRGRTMFQTSILVLLALVPALLSLAISPRAEAITEVRSISEPLGMAVSLGGIGLSASSSSPNVGAAIARNSETGAVTPLVELPTVTSVTPHEGPVAGGTKVMIAGSNLTGATEVKFGATATTGVKVISESSVDEAVATARAGTVHVIVIPLAARAPRLGRPVHPASPPPPSRT